MSQNTRQIHEISLNTNHLYICISVYYIANSDIFCIFVVRKAHDITGAFNIIGYKIASLKYWTL